MKYINNNKKNNNRIYLLLSNYVQTIQNIICFVGVLRETEIQLKLLKISVYHY